MVVVLIGVGAAVAQSSLGFSLLIIKHGKRWEAGAEEEKGGFKR